MTKPETVWIIDDDKSIRWVVEKALQKAKMQTMTFSNAKELINALQHDKPDALLTDMRMPLMGGAEVVHEIRRSDPGVPATRMIMSTASPSRLTG